MARPGAGASRPHRRKNKTLHRRGGVLFSSGLGRGSQVVRHGSAKAAFVGSIPTLASSSKSPFHAQFHGNRRGSPPTIRSEPNVKIHAQMNGAGGGGAGALYQLPAPQLDHREATPPTRRSTNLPKQRLVHAHSGLALLRLPVALSPLCGVLNSRPSRCRTGAGKKTQNTADFEMSDRGVTSASPVSPRASVPYRPRGRGRRCR